jgi:DNA-binding NtrC family response regulator
MENTKALLIVDDEETIHRALARTLRREPYELLHAYDAAEAAAILAERGDVAGVVCDHYMPGTQGLDLLIGIRRRFPDMATILLTAQADVELVMAAMNDGQVHRFVTKPWDNDALRGLLAELLWGDAPDEDARTRVLAEKERRLQRELMPLRDRSTGAFIIEDPAA